VRAHRPLRVAPVLTDDASRAFGDAGCRALLERAVADGFATAGQVPPRFDPDADAPVTLVAHLRAGVCTLGLDTAGRALHKRGWRLAGHPAVLKETLAAAILLLAGYDGSEALLDPMCGSGTLAIEGAYLALGKAPLIHRGKDDFGLEHHAGFDRALWRRVADEARAARRPSPAAPIYASDRRPEYVELARKSALRARVERDITLSVTPFQGWAPPSPTGLLVANVPYGERIGQGGLDALLVDLGRLLRGPFARWRAAVLVPADAPRDKLRLPVLRRVPLANGSLDVHLWLIEGERSRS
jgi:putative N6-adenine-specific DNA methylase